MAVRLLWDVAVAGTLASLVPQGCCLLGFAVCLATAGVALVSCLGEVGCGAVSIAWMAGFALRGWRAGRLRRRGCVLRRVGKGLVMSWCERAGHGWAAVGWGGAPPGQEQQWLLPTRER
eukprot:9324829-Prorocentrum_lima.AAC.1